MSQALILSSLVAALGGLLFGFDTAVISGAGPTVLALAEGGDADKISGLAGEGWTANRLTLDRGGAAVLPVTGTGG
jgi:hypothetical protein